MVVGVEGARDYRAQKVRGCAVLCATGREKTFSEFSHSPSKLKVGWAFFIHSVASIPTSA